MNVTTRLDISKINEKLSIVCLNVIQENSKENRVAEEIRVSKLRPERNFLGGNNLGQEDY